MKLILSVSAASAMAAPSTKAKREAAATQSSSKYESTLNLSSLRAQINKILG